MNGMILLIAMIHNIFGGIVHIKDNQSLLCRCMKTQRSGDGAVLQDRMGVSVGSEKHRDTSHCNTTQSTAGQPRAGRGSPTFLALIHINFGVKRD